MSKLVDELLRTADTKDEAMAIISHIKDSDILHEELATVRILIDDIPIEKLLFNVVVRDWDGNYAINTEDFSSPNFIGLNSERYKVHVETGETDWVSDDIGDTPSADYFNKHYRFLEEIDFTNIIITKKKGSSWERVDLSQYTIYDDEGVAHARSVVGIKPNQSNNIQVKWPTYDDTVVFSDAEPPTDVLRAVNCMMILFLMLAVPTYASLFNEIARHGIDFESDRYYVNESVLQYNIIRYHTEDWQNSDLLPFFSLCCTLSLTAALQWSQIMIERKLLTKDELPYIMMKNAEIDLCDILETILGISKYYMGVVPAGFKPLFFGVFLPHNGYFDSPQEFFSSSNPNRSYILPRSCTIMTAERIGLTSYKDSLFHEEVVLPNGVKSIKRNCQYTIKPGNTQVMLVSEFGIDYFDLTDEMVQELPTIIKSAQYCNVDLFLPSVNSDGDTDIQVDVPVSNDRHLTDIVVSGQWKSSCNIYERVADLLKLTDIRNYNEIFVSGNDNPHFFVSGYVISKLASTASDLVRIENPEYVSSAIENGTWNNRRGNLKEITISRRIACHPALLGYFSNLPLPTHSCTLLPINIKLVGGRIFHLVLVHFVSMLPRTISKQSNIVSQTLHYTTWFAPWSPSVEETVTLTFNNENDVLFRKLDEPYLTYDLEGFTESIIADNVTTKLYILDDSNYARLQDYVDHNDISNAITVLNSYATDVTTDMNDYIARVTWDNSASKFKLELSDVPLNLGVISSIEPRESITGYASGLHSVSGFGAREHLRLSSAIDLFQANQYATIAGFNINCDKLVGCYNGNVDLSSRFPQCKIHFHQSTTASSTTVDRTLSQGFGNNQLAYAYDSTQVSLPALLNVKAQYSVVEASEAASIYVPSGCDVGYLMPEPSDYESWEPHLADNDSVSYLGRSCKIRALCEGVKLSEDGASVTIHRMNERADDSEEDANFNQRSCLSAGLTWSRINSSDVSLTINEEPVDWSIYGFINEYIPRDQAGQGNYDILKILQSMVLMYNEENGDSVVALKVDGAWEHILDEDTPNYFADVQRIVCVHRSNADVSYHPSRMELLRQSQLARIVLRPHYQSGFMQDNVHYQQLHNYESAYMTNRSWSTSGIALSSEPIISDESGEPEKIFCRNDDHWSKVYIYAFRRLASNEVSELAPWPGVQMTAVAGSTSDENQWYEFVLEDFYGMWDYVIFNDSEGHQTSDLDLGDPHYYILEPSESSKAVMSYCCDLGSLYSSYSALGKTFINQHQRALTRWFNRLNIMDQVLENSVSRIGEEIIAPSLYQTKVMLDSQNFNIVSKIFGRIGDVINMGVDKITDIKDDALSRLTDLTNRIKSRVAGVFSLSGSLSLSELHILQSLFVRTHLYHKINVIDLKNYICNSSNIEHDDAAIMVTSEPMHKHFNLDMFTGDGSLIASGLQRLKSIIKRITEADNLPNPDDSLQAYNSIAADFEAYFLVPMNDNEDASMGLTWLSDFLPRTFSTVSDSYASFVGDCLPLFINPLKFINELLTSPVLVVSKLISTLKRIVNDAPASITAPIANLIRYIQGDSEEDEFITFPVWGTIWKRINNGYYDDEFPWLIDATEPLASLQHTFNKAGQVSNESSDSDDGGVLHLTFEQLTDLRRAGSDDVLTQFITYWDQDTDFTPATRAFIQMLMTKVSDIFEEQGSFIDDSRNGVSLYDSDLANTLVNFYLFPSTIQNIILDIINGIKEANNNNDEVSIGTVEDYRNRVNDWLLTHSIELPDAIINDRDEHGYISLSHLVVTIGYALTRYELLLSNMKETASVACTGFYTGMIEDIVNDEESVLSQIFNLNSQSDGNADSAAGEDETLAAKISRVIQPLSNQLLDNIKKLQAKFTSCVGSHHYDDILQQVSANVKTYVTNLVSHLQSNSVYAGLSAGMSNFMSTLEMGKNNVLSAITSALQRIPQITTFFTRRGFSIYDNDEVEFNGYQSLDGVYKALGIVGLTSCGVVGVLAWGINKALVKAYQLAKDFVTATVYDSASITYRRSGFEAIDITCYTVTMDSETFAIKFPNLWQKIVDYRSDYPAELTLSAQYLDMFIFFIVSGDGNSINISMTPKLYDVQIASKNDAVVFKAIYDSYVRNIDWLNQVNKLAFDNFARALSEVQIYRKNDYASVTYSEAAGIISDSTFNMHFKKELFDDIYADAIHAPYRRSNETVDTFIAWSLATAGVGGVIAMTGNVIPGAIIGAIGLASAGVAYLVNDYIEREKETNDVSTIMSTALSDATYGNAMITNTHIYTMIKSYPVAAAEIILRHLQYYDGKGLINNGSGAQTESGYFITCGFMRGQPKLALHLRTDLEMVLLKALRYGIMISTGVGALVMTGMATKGARLNRKLDKKNAAAWSLDQHDPKYSQKQTAIQKSIRKTSGKIDKLHSTPIDAVERTTTVIKENQSSLLTQFSIPAVGAAILDHLGYTSAADIVRQADRRHTAEDLTTATANNVTQLMHDVSGNTDGSLASLLAAASLAISTTSLLGVLKQRLRDRLGRDATDDEINFFLDSLLMGAPGVNM